MIALTQALGLVWCAVVASVLAVEEGAEVASLAAAGKLYHGLPKKDLPILTQKGLSAMAQVDAVNGEVAGNNAKLLKRLSAPWKTKITKECCEYSRIPWFKLGFMGKEYDKKSRSDCNSLCNQYMACKSYSYSYVQKKCIWSTQAVTYDSDWRFYSKKTNDKLGGPDGTYHMFPGMKFLEPTTDIEKGKSLQECEYSCTKELGCNSYSYSEPLTECARSGQSIGYSEDWEYYEKDQNHDGLAVFKEKHSKENGLKAGMRTEYMQTIDKVRRVEAKDKADLHKREQDVERTVKSENQKEKQAENQMRLLDKKSEGSSKTASKAKQLAAAFDTKMQSVTTKIDKLEKGTIEKVEKSIVSETDSATLAELKVQKQAAEEELETLKAKYAKAKVSENSEKRDLRSKFEAAQAQEEKAVKAEETEARAVEEKRLAKEKAKLMKKEIKGKDCSVSIGAASDKVAVAKEEEKKSKTNMANAQDRTVNWFKKAKMASNENHKKQYDEFTKEAKESLHKHTADEARYVGQEMKATSHEKKVKGGCALKEMNKKAYKKKMQADLAEVKRKKEVTEGSEKRTIKEGNKKAKEKEGKEEVEKETNQKAGIMKAKIERTNKENAQKTDTLKEKTSKMEKKAAETNQKHKNNKEKIKKAEIAQLQIGEKTHKTAEKERLEYNEKYKKESAEKELAEKDSEKMTIEVNKKEKLKAEERVEEARQKHAMQEEAVIEAKTEKTQKVAMEKLSKTEEGKIKAEMKRPRLSAVRRNDAGVIKVPAPGGTMLVGGGIINHYRKWNDASVFEESYPDGDQWRCDMGVGNKGQATCISLSYVMPEGTKCVNARAYTANAGVIHATLPPGYLMLSGGVQNLIRKFDKQGAFEESIPSGDRKWRCDMGFGRGELNCFVRGCKFPHGAHCVTTMGSSNNAGWVWAECPAGYQVMGCGMRNNYLHFDPKSGFEDLRPVGNKCLGDMGFGPGRVNVYARCCKINGPPPKILAPKPPAPPGTADPDSIKCIGSTRWEKKDNAECIGGDIQTITLEGKDAASIQQQVDTCARKCQAKASCTGFTFPATRSSSKKCKLKGGEDSMVSDELNKKCESYSSTNDYDSYAKLAGPCSGLAVDVSSISSDGGRPMPQVRL